MLTRLLAAMLALVAIPAAAQTAPTPAAPVRVALVTAEGTIMLELDAANAPLTTANFLRYVDSKRLDGTTFYRAMQLGEGSGIVQGGQRNGRLLYPPVAHEPTSQTGLKHLDGTISMARLEPGSARSDFFITVGPVPGFDAGPDAGGDLLGYAAFGRVVEGMDVVRKILVAPTSPTLGEGVMRGQMLEPQVRVLTARRLP